MILKIYKSFEVYKIMKKFLITALCSSVLPLSASAYIVKDIQVVGNKRVDVDTVRSYISFVRNVNIDSQVENEAIKTLYETDLFESVNLKNSNNVLIVKVKENPTVNKVVFEGNSKLKDEVLAKEISLKSRLAFTKARVQEDVNKIIELYNKNGRYGVSITPKIVNLSENRVDVIFEIKEGKESKIEKIIFIGNNHFKDSDLSIVVSSKQAAWYRFFSSADSYSSMRLEYDKDLLTQFYQSKGYANVSIESVSSEYIQSKNKFIVTFVIEEGDLYKFGDLKIHSNIENISEKDLTNLITIKKGDIFNLNNLEKIAEKMSSTLSNLGYAFVEVNPNTSLNDETKEVDITFEISKASKTYIRNIEIIGNMRTKDHVIRREMKLMEGDPYNKHKIVKSDKALKALDYFETVNVATKKTEKKDLVDLEVKVQEKSTASLGFAGGYNSLEGPIGQINFNDKNLFGYGRELDATFMRAKARADFDIGITERHFLGRPLIAGANVFVLNQKKSESRQIGYSSSKKGFALKLGYNITENLTHYLRYSFSNQKLSEIQSKKWYIDYYGLKSKKISSIGHSLYYADFDSSNNPDHGYSLELSQDVAGVGGNEKFIKHSVAANYYLPVAGDMTLLASAQAGHIKSYGKQKYVSLDEKFHLGGDDLRGFDYYGIGPRFKVCNDKMVCSDTNYRGETVGGNRYYLASLELKVPFDFAKETGIHGILFLDAGEVWGVDIDKQYQDRIFQQRGIRASCGLGFGLTTPLGPISFTYGMPLKKRRFDQKKSFNIAFKTNFN